MSQNNKPSDKCCEKCFREKDRDYWPGDDSPVGECSDKSCSCHKSIPSWSERFDEKFPEPTISSHGADCQCSKCTGNDLDRDSVKSFISEEIEKARKEGVVSGLAAKLMDKMVEHGPYSSNKAIDASDPMFDTVRKAERSRIIELCRGIKRNPGQEAAEYSLGRANEYIRQSALGHNSALDTLIAKLS